MNGSAKSKNILITGASGFIGSNFLSFAAKLKGKNLKKMNVRIIAPSHKQLDIIDIEQLKRAFDIFHPEILINFAAYRDANSAEKQRNDFLGSVWQTNVKGIQNISKISQEYKSFLIHISTDMVFSGKEDNPGPYNEESKIEANINNLSWYGWTKAEAERSLVYNLNSAIIRIGNVTQPVYDPQLDYIGKILYLFDQRKLYSLFHDQYLTLTYIPFLLDAIDAIIKSKKSGIFHIASNNIFTPYQLGSYLVKQIRGVTDAIKAVSIDEYLGRWPNRYPKFGGLSAKKTVQQLSIESLTWEEIINLFVASFYK